MRNEPIPVWRLWRPRLPASASAKLMWKPLLGMPYGFDRFAPVFTNAAIETRHSSAPLTWYGQEHGLADRNALYIENTLDLLEEAASDALDQAGLGADQIDAIVTVSSTGIATPSLDTRLMGRLAFRDDVERTRRSWMAAPIASRGIQNYWTVAGEIAVLPLAFGAWRIALIWSVLNALLLHHRIRVEEAALRPRAV